MNYFKTKPGQGLADEVFHSLQQGDHLRHDRQFLRGVVGFLRLLALPMTRRRPLARPESEMTLVIANPVAHGSRFGAAVMESTGKISATMIGDRRLADKELLLQMHHFPSLSAPSLRGLVDFRMLMWALVARQKTSVLPADHPTLSRLYLEFLFLLQAIRYRLAANYVEQYSEDHLWVSDFDRSAYCRPLLYSARNTGRPTATFVHGSPNRNYLPLVADHVLVWGEAQRVWFRSQAPQATVHVVGRPEMQPDIVMGRPRRLRIMHSLEILSDEEQRTLLGICDSAINSGMDISLRLHPSARGSDIDESWRLLSTRAELEDNGFGLLESFKTGDVVLGVTSTAIVDAVAYGLPAWTVADTSRELPCDLVDLRSASGWMYRQTIAGRAGMGLELAPSPFGHLRAGIVKATAGEARILLENALQAVLNSYYRI